MFGHNEVAQPVLRHMGVNLGCGDVGVAKHLLYAAKIGPSIKKMRCKGMPQDVRRDLGGRNPGLDGEIFQHLRKPRRRDMALLAARGKKKWRCSTLLVHAS